MLLDPLHRWGDRGFGGPAYPLARKGFILQRRKQAEMLGSAQAHIAGGKGDLRE